MNRGSFRRRARPGRPRIPTRLLGLGIAVVMMGTGGNALPEAEAQTSASNPATSSKSASPEVAATPRTNPGESGAGAGGLARSGQGTLDTRLELDLPVGCGTLAMFVDRLRARSDRIRFADEGANRAVLARISSDANGTYRATMTLLYPDGHSSSRIIEASSCNEAIDALALVTAVTLDPLSVTPGPNRPTELTPSSPQPEPPNPRNPAAVDEPILPREQERPATQTQKGPLVAPTETVLGLGVSFATFRGPSPGWMSGFEPNLRVMRASQTVFSPSIRLGFSYAEKRGIITSGGIADFAFASMTLDLCPWQLLLQTLELRSCALLHTGLVVAAGRATYQPESHRRPFWALGVSGEVIVMPSKSFGVPIRANAAFPAVRDTFAFDLAPFYQVPAVSFGVTAGLEIRFR